MVILKLVIILKPQILNQIIHNKKILKIKILLKMIFSFNLIYLNNYIIALIKKSNKSNQIILNNNYNFRNKYKIPICLLTNYYNYNIKIFMINQKG